MKKVILTFALFIAIIGSSFGQKLSIQVNSGYNYFLGTKADKLTNNENPSIGSFINGTIPLGIQVNYTLNKNFSIGAHYATQNGMAYSFTQTLNNLSFNATTNLKSAQNLGLNLKYIFSNNKIAPYLGIDAGIFMWASTMQISVMTLNIERNFTNNVNALYFTPKIGTQFTFKEFFLDVNINSMIIPAHKVKLTDDFGGIEQNVNLSQTIGIGVGLGYKF